MGWSPRSSLGLVGLGNGLLLLLAGCAQLDHSPGRLTKSISLRDRAPVVVARKEVARDEVVVRGQSPTGSFTPINLRDTTANDTTSDGYSRAPFKASEATRLAQQPYQPYGQSPYAAPNYGSTPNYGNGPVGNGVTGFGAPQGGNTTGPFTPPPIQPPPPGAYAPNNGGANGYAAPNGTNGPLPGFPAPGRPYPMPFQNSNIPGYPDLGPPLLDDRAAPPPNVTPLDVYVAETRTGRFMFGVTVNSDAGLGGQITIDERNFDIANPPRTWDDFLNGTAWRGAGQGLRIEAQPGNQVQRYMVNFTDPALFDTDIIFGASAFFFQRNYFDYQEQRLGGRLTFGYKITPNLSTNFALRAEDVKISRPRVAGVPELEEVLGSTDFYSGRINLVHDTRDHPFLSSEGHYLELAFEQAFGEFSYPRAELEYRKYMSVRERPDGSGKHIVAANLRVGISGDDTPLFENYFAGGYSSLRGYSFRGASPVDSTVRVGGTFRFLGSLEYFFPLTADDMIKGTVFCDFGTVEKSVEFNDFRVAPGVGLLFNIPALGPAPLAINFAFPIVSADTDNKQVFSFFFGASR